MESQEAENRTCYCRSCECASHRTTCLTRRSVGNVGAVSPQEHGEKDQVALRKAQKESSPLHVNVPSSNSSDHMGVTSVRLCVGTDAEQPHWPGLPMPLLPLSPRPLPGCPNTCLPTLAFGPNQQSLQWRVHWGPTGCGMKPYNLFYDSIRYSPAPVLTCGWIRPNILSCLG